MWNGEGIQKAEMASRSDRVEGAGSPSESRPGPGCSRSGSYFEVTGDLAPIYKEEGEQGPGGPGKSERDMDFVRIMMLSAQVQDVVVRVEMVGQDLLLTANRDGSQRLRRSMRTFKSALAWGKECLNHVGQHCRWPQIASRMNEIAKLPLESATRRRMQMAPTTLASACSEHMQWAQELIDMIHPAITAEDWTLMDCQEYLVYLETSLAGVATALEVLGQGR